MKDQLFKKAVVSTGSFEFDESVTEVFADMIQRSVPGYQSVIEMTGLLAQQFVTNDSHCYDLGCSLGASLISMIKAIENKPNPIDINQITFIGIDNSLPMIEASLANVNKLLTIQQSRSIHIQHQNIEDTQITNASLVAMNFTLQFIDQTRRSEIIQNIADGLNTGGALILSEKMVSTNNDNFIVPLYERYKQAQGYSELEIAKKREALVDVLVPESLHSHQQRLLEAGFSQVFPWFQCFNFCSLLAIK